MEILIGCFQIIYTRLLVRTSWRCFGLNNVVWCSSCYVLLTSFFVREVMLGFWFYRPVDQNTNTVDRSVAVVPVPPSSNLSHPSFLFLILSFIMPLQQTLFDKACTNMWTTYLRMPSNVRGCFSTGDHFCSACAGTTRPSSLIRGCFIVFFSAAYLTFWVFISSFFDISNRYLVSSFDFAPTIRIGIAAWIPSEGNSRHKTKYKTKEMDKWNKSLHYGFVKNRRNGKKAPLLGCLRGRDELNVFSQPELMTALQTLPAAEPRHWDWPAPSCVALSGG